MENVTLGETHRLLLDHIKENKSYHDKSAVFLKEMDDKINTILIATTDLGGRVKNLEFKVINPTWVTNPSAVTFSSYIFIK